MRIVVDFPAPLGPRNPTTSPLLTSKTDVVERLVRAVPFGQAARVNQSRRWTRQSSRKTLSCCERRNPLARREPAKLAQFFPQKKHVAHAPTPARARPAAHTSQVRGDVNVSVRAAIRDGPIERDREPIRAPPETWQVPLPVVRMNEPIPVAGTQPPSIGRSAAVAIPPQPPSANSANDVHAPPLRLAAHAVHARVSLTFRYETKRFG